MTLNGELAAVEPRRTMHRHGWVLVPLAIFVLTRLLSAVFVAIGASRQVALGPGMAGMTVMHPVPASPSYWQVMANWDAQWYKSIALSGYPRELPTVDGIVQMNEWAFFPLFPFLTRALMTAGMSFEVAGSLLSTVAAGLGVLVLHRTVLDKGDGWSATTVTLGICSFPTSPALQLAYTEGLALLLVALILRCVHQGAYAWLALWIFLLSLTRGIVIAVAGTLLLIWVLRWWQRRKTPFPRRDRWWLAAAAVEAALLMGLWPLLTGLVTGSPSAYVQTQAAWPANTDGLMGNWFVAGVTEGWSMLAVVLALGALVTWLGLRLGRAGLGVGLSLWMIVYGLYIMAATRPTPSILRYLLLSAGPGWLLPARFPAARDARTITVAVTVVLALVGVVGQYYWVTSVYTVAVHPGVQPYP